MPDQFLVDLVDAGAHLGHQTRRWNPKMSQFILGKHHGVHLINLEETVKQIDKAAAYLSELAKKGRKILFVGCKRQAQEAVKQAALSCGQYFVNHRWLGGTLTNIVTIRQSIKRMEYLENLDKSPDMKKMSKSELASLSRERAKLIRNLEGIRHMDGKPDVLVVVDSARESIAINEARRLKIPIVALVDSNADPDVIDYPIAANDDSLRAIRLILQNLVEPVITASKAREKAEKAIKTEKSA